MSMCTQPRPPSPGRGQPTPPACRPDRPDRPPGLAVPRAGRAGRNGHTGCWPGSPRTVAQVLAGPSSSSCGPSSAAAAAAAAAAALLLLRPKLQHPPPCRAPPPAATGPLVTPRAAASRGPPPPGWTDGPPSPEPEGCPATLGPAVRLTSGSGLGRLQMAARPGLEAAHPGPASPEGDLTTRLIRSSPARGMHGDSDSAPSAPWGDPAAHGRRQRAAASEGGGIRWRRRTRRG